MNAKTTKRRPAGGARKPTKDQHINVRCTDEQKAAIDAAAARDGMGSSTWLLSLGLRATRQPEPA